MGVEEIAGEERWAALELAAEADTAREDEAVSIAMTDDERLLGGMLMATVIVEIMLVVYSTTVVSVESWVEELVTVATQGSVENLSMAANAELLVEVVPVTVLNKMQ